MDKRLRNYFLCLLSFVTVICCTLFCVQLLPIEAKADLITSETQDYFTATDTVFKYERKTANSLSDGLAIYTPAVDKEFTLNETVKLNEIENPYLLEFFVPTYNLIDNVGGETVVEQVYSTTYLIFRFADKTNPNNYIEITLW
ncbi:MAG: hypothetical protein E7369_02550 [Clostridiales bacterium]|nr:hypothetical protein [Clostridiales bacterium]